MDDSVLAVYVEPLLVDRSVLFIGDAQSHALTRVASIAERILAFDTSAEARPGRLPNGVIEPYDPYELESVAGPVDVIVVPDILALGRSLDDRFDDLARLVGRRGHLVVGLDPRASGIDHEQLWDELATRFDCVRMAGAAPMHAIAVAELGPEDASGVVVDGSLVSQRQKTQAFIAIAGQTDPVVDGYVLVQVDDLGADTRKRIAALEEQLRGSTHEAEAARTQIAAIRRDFDTAKTERDQLREERRRIEREAKDSEARLKKAIATLEESARSGPSLDELKKLEERLAEQAERTHELESEIERRGRLVRELVEETRGRTGAASSVALADPIELDRAVERAIKAEAERAEAVFQVDELRARIAERDARAGGAISNDERDLSARVGQLTAQLMLSRERELESRGGRDLARGENLALVAQVAALETQHRELRDHVTSVLDRLSETRAGTGTGSLEDALLSIEERVEHLRGERTGLRLRLDALESGVRTTGSATSRAIDDSRPSDPPRHAEALRLENEALAADLAEAKSALRRASDTSAATRDALVERLQLELAERDRSTTDLEERERALASEVSRLREAVLDASITVEANDALTRRVTDLERDLRDAIVAAEHAASDARASAGDAAIVATERARAEAAETSLEESRRALEETRASLESLRATAESLAGAPRRRSSDVESDAAEPASRPVDEDRDLLLGALSAQLEERDDRIRALERRLSAGGPAANVDAEATHRELLDLQERAARLADELRVEREARRIAEERNQSGLGTASAAAARELERSVAQKTQALEEAEARAEGAARDVRALRDVFAETRHGLENLLGAASGSGDPELAARLGDLLTVLGRY